jgi:hypothetical protein
MKATTLVLNPEHHIFFSRHEENISEIEEQASSIPIILTTMVSADARKLFLEELFDTILGNHSNGSVDIDMSFWVQAAGEAITQLAA